MPAESPAAGQPAVVLAAESESSGAAPQAETAAEQPPFEQLTAENQPTEDSPTEDSLAKDQGSQPGIEAETVEADIGDTEQASPDAVADAMPRRTPNRITVLQPPPPKPDNFNKWLLAAGLIVGVAFVGAVAALFIIISDDTGIGTRAKGTVEQPETGSEQRPAARPDKSEAPEPGKQPAESDSRREELVRQQQIELELRQAHEKVETLRRERDAALAKARAEEEQRVRETKLAKQAAERAKAAAAALAAEKKAKVLAEKQQLAEQQRQQQQQRLEQEAREQERLRLEQEARVREQEEQRLATEREQRIQREQAEQAATEQARIQQAKKEGNAGFSADPCSGPSAKFVSNCGK